MNIRVCHKTQKSLSTQHEQSQTLKYWELQWRKTGYFIMNGATQENWKLMLESLSSLVG